MAPKVGFLNRVIQKWSTAREHPLGPKSSWFEVQMGKTEPTIGWDTAEQRMGGGILGKLERVSEKGGLWLPHSSNLKVAQRLLGNYSIELSTLMRKWKYESMW